jgi:hypothetical protein
MLGYTQLDVENMIYSIDNAQFYLPPNESNEAVRKGLIDAASFLEGLLVEGRI